MCRVMQTSFRRAVEVVHVAAVSFPIQQIVARRDVVLHAGCRPLLRKLLEICMAPCEYFWLEGLCVYAENM